MLVDADDAPGETDDTCAWPINWCERGRKELLSILKINSLLKGLDMVDNVMQFTGLDRSQPGMDVIAALSQLDKALDNVQELIDFFVA